ncbi:hypothetical protein [Saccharospirillum impatiens]|uniref:hypothetical protein n=1 Tax=Saccharospirillum impatiens TaxID=169438 RepID=UPI000407D169|nr:hypothetical protein [Saccharospirillum impatiens]
MLPFFIGFIGFVLFGVTGSIFWLVFLKALGSPVESPMSHHVLAASLSTLVSWLALALVFSGGVIRNLQESSILLIFVLPVVGMSLVWFRVLYRPSIVAENGSGDSQ